MEKNAIIKLIIGYLSDHNLPEIANKLSSESGVSLYSSEYIKILDFFKIKAPTEEQYDDLLSSLKTSLISYSNSSKENNPKDTEFLVIAYNSIFLRKVSLFCLLSEKKDIIIRFQTHISFLSSLGKKKYIENILDKLKKAFLILFQNSKLILTDIFPEILTEETLSKFLKETYEKLTRYTPLETLILKSYKNDLKKCKYHNIHKIQEKPSLFTEISTHNCSKKQIPNKILLTIDTKQTVLNIVLSNKGKYLATVLGNQFIITYSITGVGSSYQINQIKSFNSLHSSQITSLCWTKNDMMILTASKDKTIRLIDPISGEQKKIYTDVHDAMISCAILIQEDTKFISCGMNYRINITSITGEKIRNISVPGDTISELIYSEIYSKIGVISSTNNTITFYDIELKYNLHKLSINDVIISCATSKKDKGKFMLINSSKATPAIILLDVENYHVIGKYFGFQQNRFTIKCSFGGFNENFIVCGSENANINIWSRTSSTLISVCKAHVDSVNSVVWPSQNNNIIISCGEDHIINFLANETVDKIYFSDGNQFQNQGIGIGIDNKPRNEADIERARVAALNTASTLISRLGNIFRNIGNTSDEETF